MNSDRADPTPHEFIDVEISVKNLNSPADVQRLNEMLSKLKGVRTVRIARGRITVEYEPVWVTKWEMEEAIRRMGFELEEIGSAPASPISDALHGHQW